MPESTLSAVSLPPSEAIRFFRQKTDMTSEHWTDLWNEAHSRGFMVAGAATEALVADFRAEVTRAIEQGTTLAEFRRGFDAIVAKHGWTHTGTPGWRAAIIYETNLSTAYSAGRYRQMTEPDTLEAFPNWRYQHNASQHPRAQHVAWDGLVLAADDPWWGTHWPPNGWRCRCSVEPMSDRELARTKRGGRDTAPPVDNRPWRNPHTGHVVEVPHGIDPGFGYNPGKAWLDGESGSRAGRGAPTARPVLRAESVPAAARATATPGELARFIRAPQGEVEVAEVPATVRDALKADTGQVTLSADTMEKQGIRHAELTAADYQALPELLAHPDVVLRQGDARIVLLRRAVGVLRAVIKATRDRRLFVVSFHRDRVQQAINLAARLEVVDGDPERLKREE